MNRNINNKINLENASNVSFLQLNTSEKETEIQDLIKKRGNYWCLKLEGKEWYK